MKHIPLFALLMLLTGCVTSGQENSREEIQNPKATPDIVTKRVLEEMGAKVTILRPWAALKDISNADNGRFEISLEGAPGIDVQFDRDYWVIVAGEGDLPSYILNPKDGQSALNIFIGEDIHVRSDADCMKELGFSGFTKQDGAVANKKVTWRRWDDQYHLYSDCSVYLPAKHGNNAQYKVTLMITANSIERRVELEQNLESIQLTFPDPVLIQERIENDQIKFSSLQEQSAMSFKKPAGFDAVPVRENPDVAYAYAIKSSDKKFEVRYNIMNLKDGPLAQKDGDTELFIMFSATIFWNISQGCPIEALKDKFSPTTFNADPSLMAAKCELNSDFGRGYKECIVVCLRQPKKTWAYVYFMYDDSAVAEEMLKREDVQGSLKFL